MVKIPSKDNKLQTRTTQQTKQIILTKNVMKFAKSWHKILVEASRISMNFYVHIEVVMIDDECFNLVSTNMFMWRNHQCIHF